MKFATSLLSLYLSILLVSIYANGQTPAQNTAAVPRLVNFSGKAADAHGKAIFGIAGATFAIYKDQYDGAPLWLETQSVTADNNGNYTVQLGATTATGLPMDLFSTGEARWLGVTVNGETEQARVLLLSVPYALKAVDAETVGGLPASAFALAVAAPVTSRVAQTASASTLSSGATAAAPPALSGGGTLDFIPLWTPNGTTLGNSGLFQSGTGSTAKIGVNTTTPASTLDVKGTASVRGALSLPATGMATAASGKNSQPVNQVASSFNSGTNAAMNQTFRWQAEPVGNDTATPSGTLNLLYGSGSNTPAETGLKVGSNGQLTFAAGQTFPGTGTGNGTITGVTAGSGLTGGGSTGSVTLGLINTCTKGQTLQWNGTAWICVTAGGSGSVTSVALSAPTSDFTVTGSPITKSGTLGLNWNIAPDSNDTPNAIVKRDNFGNFVTGFITTSGVRAITSIGPEAIYGNDTSVGSVYTAGVGGFSTNNYGVYGYSENFPGVYAQGTDGLDAFGLYIGVDAVGPVGIAGTGTGQGSYGVLGESDLNYSGGVGVSGSGNTGVVGVSFDGAGVGVSGSGNQGVVGAGQYSSGVSGTSTYADGVDGFASASTAIGVAGFNGLGDGIYGYSSSGYAGYFYGNVGVNGSITKAGGSFKIDHPLDPARKYLYHSFVESPDMMNIYNGTITTDGSGVAVVELPEWFETLNRDFRYQLTVIGQFAQAIIASKVTNHQFGIKSDKPNVEVSWQVTGIRHDAWANAHRIPVEEDKAENEQGLYLHPDLFGEPQEKSIAWTHHAQAMKYMQEGPPKAPSQPIIRPPRQIGRRPISSTMPAKSMQPMLNKPK